MNKFEEKKFTIPELKGISKKSVDEHLKLYAGYVKNLNLIQDKMADYAKDAEANSYALGEMLRRFSFEFNGMRNHEVYFGSLEGGAHALPASSKLRKAINDAWGSFDEWLGGFKKFAATVRGIGWMALWHDKQDNRLHCSWIDEQHLGQMQNCTMILGIDMWEHSYVADYAPSGKKNYVEDFFANLNWEKIEKNFEEAK